MAGKKEKSHPIRIDSEYYNEVLSGFKTFIVRWYDTDFRVGDTIRLLEWDPVAKEFTGSVTDYKIGYVLAGGQMGIETGYCVIAIY